jgi:hypothetical protein
MAQQQAGAPQGADQPRVSTAQQTQMEASQSRTTRAPAQAAFGSGGGAAIVFRDYASI